MEVGRLFGVITFSLFVLLGCQGDLSTNQSASNTNLSIQARHDGPERHCVDEFDTDCWRESNDSGGDSDTDDSDSDDSDTDDTDSDGSGTGDGTGTEGDGTGDGTDTGDGGDNTGNEGETGNEGDGSSSDHNTTVDPSVLSGAQSSASSAASAGDSAVDDAEQYAGFCKAQEAENGEIGKESCCVDGNPVDLTSGSKLTSRTDANNYFGLLDIQRNHKLSNESSWSLGHGWHFSLDSRIILGVDVGLAEQLSKLRGAASAYQSGINSISASRNSLQSNFDYDEATDAEKAVYNDTIAALNGLINQLKSKRNHVNNTLIPPIEARKAISDARHNQNRWAVDGNYLTEEQVGIQHVKWITVSGGRSLFNESDINPLSGKRGNSSELYRTDSGYRVDTSDYSYYYGDDGLLVRIEDLFGRSLTVERENHTRITALKTDRGQVYSVSYSGNKISAITDPAGRVLRYDYDSSNGHLHKVTQFDGQTETYEYNYTGHDDAITALEDAVGNRRLNFYRQQDGKTVVDYQLDEAGHRRDYSYNFTANTGTLTGRNGLQTTKTYDPETLSTVLENYSDGSQVEMSYDDAGNLTYRWNEEDELTSFTYADFGQIASITDGENRSVVFERDARGRLLTQTDNIGSTTRYVRDNAGLVDRIEYPNGTEVDEDWVNGLLTRRVDETGNITQWQYDAAGYPTRVDFFGPVVGDTDDAFKLFNYDAIGRVHSVTEGAASIPQAQWRTTQYVYDDADSGRSLNLPVKIIDPAGREAVYRYDANNQVVFQRDFSGVETTFTYTARRQIATKIIRMPVAGSADEVQEYNYRYEYDAEGNLARAEHPGDVVWTYRYDLKNRLLESAIAGTNVKQSFEYDLAGRKIKEDDGAGGLVEYGYFADGQLKSVTNPLGNTVDYAYNTQGLLERTYNPALGGYEAQYQYNELDQLVAATDANNHTRYLGLNARGQIEDTFATNSQTEKLIDRNLDWRGNIVRELDATGGWTDYGYNGFGELTSVLDSEGATLIQQYDALGRMVSQQTPAGLLTEWQYDQQATQLVVTETQTDLTMSQVRLDRTRTSVKQYDLMGRLHSYTDAEAQTWQFHYNERGLLAQTLNPDGSASSNSYDAAGRIIQQTQVPVPGSDEQPRITRFKHDAKGRVTEQVQPHYPLSVVDTFRYNGLGQLLEATVAGQSQGVYEYDANGRRVAAHYAFGLSEFWQYDANGNLLSYTDRDGYEWQTQFDADNRPVWRFDASSVEAGLNYGGGQGTQTHYDALGRMLAVTDPLGNHVAQELDSQGRTVASIDALGARTETVLDVAGRPTQVTDAHDNVTSFRYNGFGELEQVTDRTGASTYYQYDRLGRQVGQQDALGYSTQWQYNYRDQVTEWIDARNASTQQRYNSFGNLTEVVRPGPNGDITSAYQWRADNQLTSVTSTVEQSPYAQQTLSYDLLGNLTEFENELGDVWQYRYDALNRVTDALQPEAGTDIQYQYTGRGQLSERSFWHAGEQQTEAFDYDANGRLAATSNGVSAEQYQYDAAGRLSRVSNDLLGQTFDYQYDANGQRISAGLGDGDELQLTRDTLGRIVTLERVDTKQQRQIFTFSYDDEGRLLSTEYPNHSRRSVRYDALGRVVTIRIDQEASKGKHFTGQWYTLEQFQYAYDGNGNVISETRNGYDAYFEYDSLNRLVLADFPKDDDIRYGWDDAGNLVQKTTKTRDFSYQYNDANQLVQFQAHRMPGIGCLVEETECTALTDEPTLPPHWFSYRYDANGQSTQLASHNGVQQLMHDPLGRMTAVTSETGEAIEYGYDARDRRVLTERPEQGNGAEEGARYTLISAYDGRTETGQWRVTEQGQNETRESYRQLTILPAGAGGQALATVLHQQLSAPKHFELHASTGQGSDFSDLYLYGDRLNSTVWGSDAMGIQAMRLGYSPMGQVYLKNVDSTFWKVNSGVNANHQLRQAMPYQYTGRYTEGATGFVQMDARWYNPHTSRFVQPDLWNFRNSNLPAAIQREVMRFAGLNAAALLRDPSQQMVFGYVGGNPLSWVDPLGLCIPEGAGYVAAASNGGVSRISSAYMTANSGTYAVVMYTFEGDGNVELLTYQGSGLNITQEGLDEFADTVVFGASLTGIGGAAMTGYDVYRGGMTWGVAAEAAMSRLKVDKFMELASGSKNWLKGVLGRSDVPNTKALPGPEVPEYHLGNFTDGVAVNRQVSGDEVFFKYHGKDNRLGQTHNYVTQKQYATEGELRNDLAILDEWGIEIDRVTTFQPPKGTWISEGTAAKQVGDFTDEFRPGGGYQGLIDINNLPKSSWIRTDKLPEGFNQ